MPPNHVTKTHLKLYECLWCKAWADLGEILGDLEDARLVLGENGIEFGQALECS